MDGQLVSADIVLPFPTLRETCVKRIIRDTEKIVEGLEFNELASPKYSFILGPFSYLGMRICSCMFAVVNCITLAYLVCIDIYIITTDNSIDCLRVEDN